MTWSDKIKLWGSVIVGTVSLIVAIINHLSVRTNQKEVAKLQAQYHEENAARDAKRDYQYDARKRLYRECGPILFQLSELSESAFHRITGLAKSAREGNLEPDDTSFLREDYYFLSTLYRILAPSAALKLMQQRLTLVDLSLDYTMYRQYIVARQAFFAFGDEFNFAKLGPRPLDYEPFDPNADTKARKNPAVFARQGYPLGAMEKAIEVLIAPGQTMQPRVMTYAECEADYSLDKSRVREAFDEIDFLIKDFHPRTKPVFWRMLTAQAILYRSLEQSTDMNDVEWGISNLTVSAKDSEEFDWRGPTDSDIGDDLVLEPIQVAHLYLEKYLGPRLARVKINSGPGL